LLEWVDDIIKEREPHASIRVVQRGVKTHWFREKDVPPAAVGRVAAGRQHLVFVVEHHITSILLAVPVAVEIKRFWFEVGCLWIRLINARVFGKVACIGVDRELHAHADATRNDVT
jgi:hypothetical protein